MKNETTKETHPSYGMISLTRASGTGRLFGSPLSQHFGTIRIRVSNGSREHNYGEDRYHDEKQIVTVELSASQFAEAITCMGAMPGVPCTVRWIRGIGSIENVPETEHSEMHRAKESFRSNVTNIVGEVRKRGKEIAEILVKDKLSKDDKNKIAKLVDFVVQEVDQNAPFFVEQFQEATDKVAQKAKAEVVAMFEHAIRQAGLKHLASLGTPNEDIVPALPEHDNPK